jgi:hypothetical protein
MWIRIVRAGTAIALTTLLAGGGRLANAQPGALAVRVTMVKPQLFLVADSMDNLVVYTGKEASLVAGVQSPALVARAKALLSSEKAGPVRFVVMMESEDAPSYGDGGWRATGATTMAHEFLWDRIYMALHPDSASAASNPSPRPVQPGADIPLIGFSAVVATYFGDGREEQIHFIRERSGYTSADVIVHIEQRGVVYLGNTYTTNGYPLINAKRGGRINGIIATANYFITSFGGREARASVIVPGRGPVGTLNDLHEYHDMLVAVRDSVQKMIEGGKSVDEAVAAKPSAAFDARWGHGPVTPDQFVASVYTTIPRPKK